MNTKTQKLAIRLIGLGSVLAIFMSLSFTSHAGLYRWVDASGKVHFSDKVPPKVASQGHSELSENGVETKKVLSAAEVEKNKAEELALKEENKLSILALEEEKKAQQGKRKHDAYLLTTFDSKDELIVYYENKITTLSGTAAILKARNDILNKKVKRLIYKRKSAPTDAIKKSLDNKISDLKTSVKQYSKALVENEVEVLNLKQQYNEDLKRFIELASR